MHMQKTTTNILVLALMLGTSGCMATIPYWKSVEKEQQENFELADELKWQQREEAIKAKKAQEANTPAPDKPFKPSDF